MGVHEGIAQRTAGAGADLSRRVAVFICRGSADECHVDLKVAAFDCPGTRAVRTKNDRLLETDLSGDHGVSEFSADAAGFNAGDRSVFHKFHNRGVLDVDHRAGGKTEIFDAEFTDRLKHLADDLIALAEAVVEGDRVSVLEPCGQNGIFQRFNELCARSGAEGGAALRNDRAVDFFRFSDTFEGADVVMTASFRQFPAD